MSAEIKMQPAFSELLRQNIIKTFAVKPENASKRQVYDAFIATVNDILAEKRLAFEESRNDLGSKCVYYMSMEFLPGPSLKNNIFNLGLAEEAKNAVAQYGFNIDEIYDAEPDAGLGNGGLGRLASCYLDALTACHYEAQGFSIRYDYGIFKQRIENGRQYEVSDDWLDLGAGNLRYRPDESCSVIFGGNVYEEWNNGKLRTIHTDYYTVVALAYDMFISGGKSNAVNVLRLWKAKSDQAFDISLFSSGEYVKSVEKNAQAEAISKVLYPADNHVNGKTLRLKQQYFFVSASLQTIVKRHLERFGSLDTFPSHAAIHINDTHPALCVPELMRILMDRHGYSWEDAWNITSKTLAYTNHTVMAEALETWPVELFKSILPRIFSIVCEINRRFVDEIQRKNPELTGKLSSLAVVSDGMVRMANLCVISCFSVNGVSKLHSQILKDSLFADYNKIYPGKFSNVTNGIAYRRWLCLANPRLSGFIEDLIGSGFKRDLAEISRLEKYVGDSSVLSRLAEIKLANKERLTARIIKDTGIAVDPSSIFDVQVKRLHEYKRQLLNALHIISLYRRIKYEGLVIKPRTFIFAAKASAGYFMAKEVIYFINMIAQTVNGDPSINGMLKVVFIPDYRVSLAEIILPAAEISEQISLAGLEASGTGNMKMMLNGALTLGTRDGANIEIAEAVGEDNVYFFGMDAEAVSKLRASGYDPSQYLSNFQETSRCLDALKKGLIGGNLGTIVTYIEQNDFYMSLADFDSYSKTQSVINDEYSNVMLWNKKSLINIARSGIFSADRSVREYADRIWKISPTN